MEFWRLMPSLLDAVEAELEATGTPLNVADITQRILASGAWSSGGKTPAATVESRLAVDVKRLAAQSRFVRVAPRTYGLRKWPDVEEIPPKPSGRLTFLDAAERVLEESREREPMSYREITDLAIDRRYIAPEGLTPAQTMYVQLMTDVKRRQQRADEPRFVQHPKGLFSLARWAEAGLVGEIQRHNKRVKTELRQRLIEMKDPYEFEQLIGRLLSEMGFENVEVTKRSKDGGIDVRATFVAGDIIRTDMAIQVKKWRGNVHAPEVQKLRGALDPNERGLLITTSGFERGARAEATREKRAPIGLVDGEQLVSLLVEHQIGVSRGNPELLQPLSLDAIEG